MLRAAEDDVLAYMAFPREHWTLIYSTNVLERLNREIKRRTDVVSGLPEGCRRISPDRRHLAQDRRRMGRR